jgi:hypothetical protein
MKYLSMTLKSYRYMITGNYINFAVCEYYQDDIFSVLSQLVLTSLVSGVDYDSELKLFTKLHQQSYEVLALFFQKHREIMFLKFEATLINSILDFAMKGLAEAQNYELQSQATAIIVSFNEFCYEKLQKSPNEKGTSNNCV